jgi:threonine dehydrogenase-like Zn-dependent dehydrogenase
MTSALWYISAGKAELRSAPPAVAGPGQVVVEARYSALSRGTERLVCRGQVPSSEYERMRCPHQEGAFPFPVKYGYALAGVITGGARSGEQVFVLHPHQAGVPLRRATLAANAETALNVVWDAAITSGDKVLIVGGGVLGLLTAAIAARIPGTVITVVDQEASRKSIAGRLGAGFALPAEAPKEQDVVIHTSASESGLDLALNAAGFEARVVEASWYGDRKVPVSLGGAFHSRRLRLISSQVGSVPAHRRGRWSNARRLAAALALLREDVFDELITAEVPFAEAATLVPAALAEGTPGLATVLRY